MEFSDSGIKRLHFRPGADGLWLRDLPRIFIERSGLDASLKAASLPAAPIPVLVKVGEPSPECSYTDAGTSVKQYGMLCLSAKLRVG